MLNFTVMLLASLVNANDLVDWKPLPEAFKGFSVAKGKALLTSDKWSYLVAPEESSNNEVSATLTINDSAKQFGFFGSSWSAWPDASFGDGGFDAALLLRGNNTSGYRVQLSHKYQVLALVKFPEGGYLRVVPFNVKLKEPHLIKATIAGNQINVNLDGKELIRYIDNFLPVDKGLFGVGVSSGAKVEFSAINIKKVEPTPIVPSLPYKPNFSVRKFLGGRDWVFDGDEPILQLHYEKDPSCFAKLRPGYKPQINFDSHWGLENQGAFNDAASKWTTPNVSGGGDTIKVNWSSRNVKDRFVTKSILIVGYDTVRKTYTYDIDSELEVLPGQPFHFRYGFDFEHHTPLDPFRWQYLIAKKKNGDLYHRPVYPIDPGPQNDLETYHGFRVWYGRHGETMHVAPSVEYAIEPDWNRIGKDPAKQTQRKLNTAVCAAFYDTGVSFEPETSEPGTKVRVKYRYTGIPAVEADGLFNVSKIYDSPTLDPNHHYIFADEWPKITFSKFEPMSKSWILGRSPFMTAHNTRPTYDLEKNCGAGSGFAMKLGPASFGKANLPIGATLSKGRYVVSALVKLVNVHGHGGRIELEASQTKTNKSLAKATHFAGNGNSEWKKQGFVFEVPEDAGALSLALGNSGTGEMLVTDVEFKKLEQGESIPIGILAKANDQPASMVKSPEGAIADYRMLEGKGHSVYNYAGGSHLDLANLQWVVDSGKPALRFAENTTGTKSYRLDGTLGRMYFSHPSNADKSSVPVALSGHHGGGETKKGLTLTTWIKPDSEMGKSQHAGRADIIGYGARRFILALDGQKAPYTLSAKINVNDVISSPTKLDAGRWYHVALTAEPKDGQWLVRTYIDGKQSAEGMTKKFPSDSVIPPSLILGCEIFYFHSSYYRGLIGQTMVFNRSLNEGEILELAK